MAKSLSELIREVGGTLSGKEAEKIAKQTGKSVAEVLAKAQKLNIDIGAGAVKTYNASISTPAPSASAAEAAAKQALAPLEGLVIDPGNVYQGTSGTQNGVPIVNIAPRGSNQTQTLTSASDPNLAAASSSSPMTASQQQLGGSQAPAGPDYTSIMAPFLEMMAASTAANQQQMADLSAMMTAGIANSQAMYQQQMAQNAALAEQEAAANRAFMINSSRQTSPANLQLGIGYNQNKLAGTEGFKYRPQSASSVPIAFTSPTLSASAASQVPTVINV